ncbi:hypothetical protein SCHPADRAFT_910748, partial [Schizopora paradoxa]
MRRPRPLACPLFCIKILMCQWGLPPSSDGLAVDLRSTDIRSGGLLEAHAPLESPSYPCAGVDLGLLTISSSLSRDHTSLQSGVVGSATRGGGLHSCLARA